jgi:hypothetical protein
MSYVKLPRAVPFLALSSLFLVVFGCGGLSPVNLSSSTPPRLSAANVSISPNTAVLQAGNSLQFTAAARGPANTDLEWLANGVVGGNSVSGTISRSGLYTATQTVAFGTSVVVTARSKADLSDSGSATVTLLPTPAPVTVVISPATATVQPGQSQQFTATIDGTANTGITWLVNDAQGGNSSIGTVSPTGVYSAPKAVASASSVTITAKSSYSPTSAADALVTIVPSPSPPSTGTTLPTPAPVTVSISPATANLQPGQSQQFTATVDGTSNTGITWLVNNAQGGNSSIGTVSSTGVYSAPQAVASVSSLTITAKSSYNRTSAADAVVTIVPSPSPPSTGTTYYVSPNGNNQRGDGSLNNPWATLSFACSHVTTFGDIIHVNAGAYTDNTQCVLSLGVQIEGHSPSTVTIATTANPFISAVSNIPTVNGSNEISGITFVGNGANAAIASTGRNNQSIHNNVFHNFPVHGVLVQGKIPLFISAVTTCSNFSTATSQAPNIECTVEPASTDWATGITIYQNTATNTNFMVHTVKGAAIYDNTIDNSANAGVSAFGHTAYFWSGVRFYNNTLRIHDNERTNINLEVWEIQDDTIFHDNVFDGWVSLVQNTHGVGIPYSYEIYNNDFSSNIIQGNLSTALEVGFFVSNVRIDSNFFSNTGGNVTYHRAIGIWGTGPVNSINVTRNVLYNINGAGIEINSTFVTPEALLYPANIANVYIYNNAFDTMASGASAAVLLVNDGSSGAMSDVIVKNNIITDVSYGVNFYPRPQTMHGNVYSHNVINRAQGDVNYLGRFTFTIGTIYSFVPEILASGNRWKNYYCPNGASSNLVSKGTDVGLTYSGAAPDVGPGCSLAPPADSRGVAH